LLEILLMLRSSIVLLEDQPPYFESLWNQSNNYLATTIQDVSNYDFYDLDDLFEDFDYRSLIFDLGLTDTESSISSPFFSEQTPQQGYSSEPKSQEKRKEKRKAQKYEKNDKKAKYSQKKGKPIKFNKRFK
ncbi:hypothetical protein PENTCL1PPCAC_25835, partial [Pristionchus entomophagus]